jgi:hypothetical protein
MSSQLGGLPMDSNAFYTTVSSVSFTLLGLWWVVVQGRADWRREHWRRVLAYVVSLHFLLPGAMAVLSLVAPDVGWLWRMSFTVAGLLGVLGVLLVIRVLRTEAQCPRIVQAIQWLVLPVYALVTLLALLPELVTALVADLRPLQVEGVILATLLFFGVQSAWVMMVELGAEPAAESDKVAPPRSAASRSDAIQHEQRRPEVATQ